MFPLVDAWLVVVRLVEPVLIAILAFGHAAFDPGVRLAVGSPARVLNNLRLAIVGRPAGGSAFGTTGNGDVDLLPFHAWTRSGRFGGTFGRFLRWSFLRHGLKSEPLKVESVTPGGSGGRFWLMSVAVGSRADQAVEIVILAAWRIAPFFAIAAALFPFAVFG